MFCYFNLRISDVKVLLKSSQKPFVVMVDLIAMMRVMRRVVLIVLQSSNPGSGSLKPIFLLLLNPGSMHQEKAFVFSTILIVQKIHAIEVFLLYPDTIFNQELILPLLMIWNLGLCIMTDVEDLFSFL